MKKIEIRVLYMFIRMIRLIVELRIKSKRNTREHLFRSASLARLLLLLGTAEAWWRRANLTGDARSIADVTVMDGRRDAVVLLQVDLRRMSLFKFDKK